MTTAEYQAYLDQEKRITDASVKGETVFPKKTRNTSATNSLTKAIVALLTMRGCRAWRQNNAAVYDASFGGYRKGSTTPGISDVMGYHRATGRIIAVEVKTGKDVLSDEQTAFLEEVRRAGGFACEGRSLKQVEEEYGKWLKTTEG